MSRLDLTQITQIQRLEDKKINTLKKEELIKFYQSKKNWDIKEIAQFEKRLEKLKKEDLEYFHSIAGFNFFGYGDWIVESYDFALDVIVAQIGKVHRYNECKIKRMQDYVNYRMKVKNHYPLFQDFAMDRKYKFMKKIDLYKSAFNYYLFQELRFDGFFGLSKHELVFRNFKRENRSMKIHRYKMECGYENIEKSPYLQA